MTVRARDFQSVAAAMAVGQAAGPYGGVEITGPLCQIGGRFGAVAQLGERRVRNAKVGSSILLGSTIISIKALFYMLFMSERPPLAAGWRINPWLFGVAGGGRCLRRLV